MGKIPAFLKLAKPNTPKLKRKSKLIIMDLSLEPEQGQRRRKLADTEIAEN
jgi:hypothetical protein